MSDSLHIVLRCAPALLPRVRYVFDTLLLARGMPVAYVEEPPTSGPWVLYGRTQDVSWSLERCLVLAHCPDAWHVLEDRTDITATGMVDGLVAALPQRAIGFVATSVIAFDIVANSFYFLSSWSERLGTDKEQTRRLYSNSVYARLSIPQDIVDQYLHRLMAMLQALCDRIGIVPSVNRIWPDDKRYALVLSHDVDFLPNGLLDIARQGVKTVLRHLVRQRDVADAIRAAIGLASAILRGRDPYGCVPEIIRREKELGVQASFQVAVGHRHPDDVNYRIEDDRIRAYLQAIPAAGFELCLHGSYRSTENPLWYAEEAALLTQRLGKPIGSRQHFLSFDYDALFAAQEQAGIQYDMSMGFPDRIGPRAGFSYPYFPFCLDQDRPYDVLEISLFLMDVTLCSYMALKGVRAWESIHGVLEELARKGGCVSAVWHPIVFGGARDPGFDRLFWEMVKHVAETGGLATDGRTVNAMWRARAKNYPSFVNALAV